MAMFERAFAKRELQDPSWFRRIFADTRLAPLWALARMYLGYQWLLAGWHKLWGDDRWVNVPGQDGLQLQGFWTRATAIPEEGSPPIKYDWYRDFLSYMLDHEWYTWFSWVIALGEVLAGVALIVGAFTGIAALAGATMNFNFMLAGSASTNPVLFVLAIVIMFGWKVAGWIGVDRWLLPALGTPWQPGAIAQPIAEAAGRGAPGLRAGARPT
jgi:thiosulfate dehydrogenase [quinone] large subunit